MVFPSFVMLITPQLAACDAATPAGQENTQESGIADSTSLDSDAPSDTAPSDSAAAEDSADSAKEVPPPDLQVQFLSVGGFYLKVGNDAIMTAPLYTNPDLWETLTEPVVSNPQVIDRYLPDVSDARAILVGHAHYDHLLDVPYVRTLTDDATIYGNESVARIMATFAPEPTDECVDRVEPQEWSYVPEDRVIDVTDPASDVVDYRNCGGVETCFDHSDDAAGDWLSVEGTNVRVRALCSSHPDQFWVIHFGQGCMEEGVCEPPTLAQDWLEGTTVAWLIDFLDQKGNPMWRVYYQDAPTDAPIGHPSADLLAEKSVDLALLNAGNYEVVADHPGEFIRLIQPRFVIMGHWEDFFRTLDQDVQPLPFMNLDDLRARLEVERPGGEGLEWWIPDPGTEFSFSSQ